MSTDYLAGLNEPQQEAVQHTEGPLLVLAGAGSGKTRVITHRIVHLIHKGIAPHNILAVTFTNKAATEMRERVRALMERYPSSARAGLESYPTVTTFHALGVRLLREHHTILNLPRHFVIYDRSDSLRAIKKSLELAGHNPKQFEPRKMLSMISRAKGDALTRADFVESASNYPEQVAGEIWEHYTAILQKDGALDFDDLLGKTLRLLEDYPVVREVIQSRFRYVHVDEYQDTNKIQFTIARLITGQAQNICVVGDIDQCLTGDTMVTMADEGTKRINKIIAGDRVLSNYGSGDYRPAVVSKVYTNKPLKNLTTITTDAGKTITSTPQHLHFAGYRLGPSPQRHFVYLMRKEGVGYRLGTTSVYTKGQVKPMLGFVQRLNQEHGDAVWVLETFDTVNQARVAEYALSLQYQLPTVPFVARTSNNIGGYAHDQAALDDIFQTFNTTASAKKILRAYHVSEHHPHHRPQVSKSQRQNILVILCDDHRGATPMHRISVAGSNTTTKKVLEKAGYAIRPARVGSARWRFETCHASYEELCNVIKKLKKLLPHAVILEQGRLGTSSGAREKNSLPVIPAASVRPGMVLFAADGSYDVVRSITHDVQPQQVYDLTVVPTHNFVANGICTHNSIYSWRGADISNVLQFERHFVGAKTILLEENYRSTQTIIAASNNIITRNKNRVEKNVFTQNATGEKITLYAANQGIDEAEYIALQCKTLVREGARPSDIAILFRTNFQSRVLEEAFLNFEVPYQVLGTKFFERKEVKDVLSVLRLALNPDTTADLARIVNVPPRGIGKVTTLKIIEGRRKELTGATAEKVARFDQMMQDITDHAKNEPISATLRFIISRTGLETHLKKSGTEEDLERLENLRELVSLAVRYDELGAEEGVEALLENAALQSDQDEIKHKEEYDAVRLMTVHASKGLEFPYVFITGLEEGLFPHARLDDTGVDHEEERRLFYVALTRAEKKVWLTYAHMRTIFGSQRINVPSTFLNDIDTEHVDMEGSHQSGRSNGYETTIFLD